MWSSQPFLRSRPGRQQQQAPNDGGGSGEIPIPGGSDGIPERAPEDSRLPGGGGGGIHWRTPRKQQAPWRRRRDPRADSAGAAAPRRRRRDRATERRRPSRASSAGSPATAAGRSRSGLPPPLRCSLRRRPVPEAHWRGPGRQRREPAAGWSGKTDPAAPALGRQDPAAPTRDDGIRRPGAR